MPYTLSSRLLLMTSMPLLAARTVSSARASTLSTTTTCSLAQALIIHRIRMARPALSMHLHTICSLPMQRHTLHTTTSHLYSTSVQSGTSRLQLMALLLLHSTLSTLPLWHSGSRASTTLLVQAASSHSLMLPFSRMARLSTSTVTSL